jgi:hypothetical protein
MTFKTAQNASGGGTDPTDETTLYAEDWNALAGSVSNLSWLSRFRFQLFGRQVKKEWHTIPNPTDKLIYEIDYSKELGIYVGVCIFESGICSMYSYDLETWASSSFAGSIRWMSVCWSPTLKIFVIVGRQGSTNNILTSTNGTSWTARSTGFNSSFSRVKWSEEAGLFVGFNGGAYSGYGTSPNGIDWTHHTVPGGTYLIDFTYDPIKNRFVGVTFYDSYTAIIESADLLTWSEVVYTDIGTQMAGIAFSPDLNTWVIAGGGTSHEPVWSSVDLLTWTRQFSDFPIASLYPLWVGEFGVFIVPSDSRSGQKPIYSYNAVDWYELENGPTHDVSRFKWLPDAGIFVSCAGYASPPEPMRSSFIATD